MPILASKTLRRIPGSLDYWPGSTPPLGAVRRNGAALSRTAYARLFAVIGTTYGAGDGVTTFNVPDDRGEAIRGLDDGKGVDPGRVLGSAQLDALQNITGTLAGVLSYPGASGTNAFTAGGSAGTFESGSGSNAISTDISFDASRVARTAPETRMRNRAYLAIQWY